MGQVKKGKEHLQLKKFIGVNLKTHFQNLTGM